MPQNCSDLNTTHDSCNDFPLPKPALSDHSALYIGYYIRFPYKYYWYYLAMCELACLLNCIYCLLLLFCLKHNNQLIPLFIVNIFTAYVVLYASFRQYQYFQKNWSYIFEKFHLLFYFFSVCFFLIFESVLDFFV